MLEQKDLEMISEIVSKSIEPLKREVREIGLTLENEKEMLLIRVNQLENELRRLKERIDAIA